MKWLRHAYYVMTFVVYSRISSKHSFDLFDMLHVCNTSSPYFWGNFLQVIIIIIIITEGKDFEEAAVFLFSLMTFKFKGSLVIFFIDVKGDL